MKKIAQLNINNTPKSKYKKFRKRAAVRAIIIDDKDNVALAYVAHDDYYKIPGGGVDEGEDLIEALRRECLEEAGVEITNIKSLGYIVDINSIWSLAQKSNCYIAMVAGEKIQPKFTKKERAKGFELHWVPLGMVIEVMRATKPKRDTEKHLKERDLLFMKKFFEKK